jgi:cation/acetate symporter
MNRSTTLALSTLGLATLLLFAAEPAFAQAVAPQWRFLTFGVFAVIIGVTMYVTYLAAKRVKTSADFYAAGGGVTGLQNGWAIAGDYLSAACSWASRVSSPCTATTASCIRWAGW